MSKHRDYDRSFNPGTALQYCELLLDDIEAARVALATIHRHGFPDTVAAERWATRFIWIRSGTTTRRRSEVPTGLDHDLSVLASGAPMFVVEPVAVADLEPSRLNHRTLCWVAYMR